MERTYIPGIHARHCDRAVADHPLSPANQYSGAATRPLRIPIGPAFSESKNFSCSETASGRGIDMYDGLYTQAHRWVWV